MIDLIELRSRILAVHAGTLPPDAVTPEELRTALEQLREERKRKSTAASTTSDAPKKRAPSAATVDLNSLQSASGGLLDLLRKSEG